jgi:hypothetical protein
MPLLSHPLCGGAIRWATPACHKQMIDSCGRGQALSDLLSKNTVDFFKSAHLTAQQQTHALMHRNSRCGRSYRRSVQLSPSLRTALLSVSRPPVTAPVHTSPSVSHRDFKRNGAGAGIAGAHLHVCMRGLLAD